MPRYDYVCKKCNKQYEVSHPMEYAQDVKCPRCEKPMKKRVTRAAVYVR
jgi:putative FmdB family regulatory protein